MTLDEAIKHCEEVVEKQEKIAIYTPIEMLNSDVDIEKCQECANEHRQLAEWLKDYKRMKEQEPTTKNDLGVDAISRAEVQTEIEMNASRYTIAKERGGMGQVEWSDKLIKVSDAVDIIRNLPSVTPQEPQTFEWCTDCKEYDQEKHCCHRWSKVIRNTVQEMKQEQEPKIGHWIDDEFGSKCSCCGIHTHLDKFDRPMKFWYCSMCGAKMVESQEGDKE